MSPHRGIAAAAIVAIGAIPASATCGQVSTTIHLRAYVPIYCNIEMLPALGMGQDDGVVNLGMSQEVCNAPRGYRVILQHPANMPGAAVISDNDRIPLSDSGETVLSNSDHPAIRLRQLALDVGNDPAQLSHLGIRIEVKY